MEEKNSGFTIASSWDPADALEYLGDFLSLMDGEPRQELSVKLKTDIAAFVQRIAEECVGNVEQKTIYVVHDIMPDQEKEPEEYTTYQLVHLYATAIEEVQLGKGHFLIGNRLFNNRCEHIAGRWFYAEAEAVAWVAQNKKETIRRFKNREDRTLQDLEFVRDTLKHLKHGYYLEVQRLDGTKTRIAQE